MSKDIPGEHAVLHFETGQNAVFTVSSTVNIFPPGSAQAFDLDALNTEDGEELRKGIVWKDVYKFHENALKWRAACVIITVYLEEDGVLLRSRDLATDTAELDADELTYWALDTITTYVGILRKQVEEHNVQH